MARTETAYVIHDVKVSGSRVGEIFPLSEGAKLPAAMGAFGKFIAERPQVRCQVNMTVSQMVGAEDDPESTRPSEKLQHVCISNTDGKLYLSVPS